MKAQEATAREEARAIPYRQIRAEFDDDTITVYQAYNPVIADAAIAAGTFVPPWRSERMTWIKPSFLWMMYRCGYCTKPGQERVLAIKISKQGLQEALTMSCLSHFTEGDPYRTKQEFQEALHASPVRIQWDPERDLEHNALPYRSIQIGISKEASSAYVHRWIRGIRDVTPLVLQIGELVRNKPEGWQEQATALLPKELPFDDQLPADIKKRIGMLT